MSENNRMIRDIDGRYWLQTTDDDGRRRSSYLGNIGQASIVEAWCLGRGIEFRQISSSPGRSGLTESQSVKGGRARRSCPRQPQFAAIGT
jgi:hypothetical protein